MSDPSLALQKAVVAALRADVTAVSGRVYDHVPADATAPYIAVGDWQTLDASVECVDSTEIIADLHVWSRGAVGQVEAKEIASAVRASLHGADLTLDDFALVEILHRDTRMLRDPDGISTHAVVTFRALVDPA